MNKVFWLKERQELEEKNTRFDGFCTSGYTEGIEYKILLQGFDGVRS